MKMPKWLDGNGNYIYGYTCRKVRHLLRREEVRTVSYWSQRALCGRSLAWRLTANVPAGPICRQCWRKYEALR